MNARAAIYPAAALLAAACATRSDVQVVRNDLLALKTERAQQDSALRAELARVIAALSGVTDSIGSVSTRMSKLQGDMRTELFDLGQQLIQIQELTGQSQRRLQELRSSLEQRNPDIGAPAPAGAAPGAPAPPVGDTSAAGRGAGVGPNQLFQLALDQLRRGSAGAAAAGFQELLRQHPNADVAPEAQFYLGEAYAAQGNAAAADSAYAAVVTRYPRSPRAPTALYKRALTMEGKGDVAGARTALNQIVRQFPRSTEAALARDRLRTLR